MMKHLLILIVMASTQVNASWFSQDYVHGVSQEKVEILSEALKRGDVLFIDTREPGEYLESRIPTAVNIPLRDVGSINIEEMRSYKYVVPYCLKDFRGFETAKILQSKGLTNVVLMEPAGFNGWRSLKMPIEK
ncbi:rhodanese-like domain-containing protein [Photobacterium sanguinicancri]|uniref:rhodanese-like domain-containing protein n=1 Tax=Photobacterium sanguinicancri TaxID=875932 RepID=UPI00248042C5|nr:rhodanese-like domain-containing protein [Photobacterium sanguinicancri]